MIFVEVNVVVRERPYATDDYSNEGFGMIKLNSIVRYRGLLCNVVKRFDDPEKNVYVEIPNPFGISWFLILPKTEYQEVHEN